MYKEFSVGFDASGAIGVACVGRVGIRAAGSGERSFHASARDGEVAVGRNAFAARTRVGDVDGCAAKGEYGVALDGGTVTYVVVGHYGSTGTFEGERAASERHVAAAFEAFGLVAGERHVERTAVHSKRGVALECFRVGCSSRKVERTAVYFYIAFASINAVARCGAYLKASAVHLEVVLGVDAVVGCRCHGDVSALDADVVVGANGVVGVTLHGERSVAFENQLAFAEEGAFLVFFASVGIGCRVGKCIGCAVSELYGSLFLALNVDGWAISTCDVHAVEHKHLLVGAVELESSRAASGEAVGEFGSECRNCGHLGIAVHADVQSAESVRVHHAGFAVGVVHGDFVLLRTEGDTIYLRHGHFACCRSEMEIGGSSVLAEVDAVGRRDVGKQCHPVSPMYAHHVLCRSVARAKECRSSNE